MGRNRWQGGLELLVLCILVLHHIIVLADGDVGKCNSILLSRKYENNNVYF